MLTVPQGTRLNIIPAEDIWLRDPERLQAVTSVKGNMAKAVKSNSDLATQLLPGLVEALAENPSLRKLAPQATQQILQANVLQQLRDSNLGNTASGNAGSAATVNGASAETSSQAGTGLAGVRP